VRFPWTSENEVLAMLGNRLCQHWDHKMETGKGSRFWSVFRFNQRLEALRGSQFGRIRVCVIAVALLLGMLPGALSTHAATGRFEVYCDSFGFFLAKVDGAPAPRDFFLFLYRGFPAFVVCRSIKVLRIWNRSWRNIEPCSGV